MGGGLMQLVAYGAQDIYLTGSPQITFFKVVYRRHTNFAIEAIEQTFNGAADFGRKVTCTISRNGDLIHRMYLQATLSVKDATITKLPKYFGHYLIKEVELEIGGQKIDKHYSDWLQIWNELTQTAEKQSGYDAMIGHEAKVASASTNVHTIYIPLQFWFCRNPGLALPLIALQYHEVKVNLEFASRDAAGVADLDTCTMDEAKLYCDYIYLDTEERKRFAQVSHEYLIEQLQFTGDESVANTNVKARLNFNHPVKELIWVVKKDGNANGNFLDGAATPVNPVVKAKLQLNGHDRFSERAGSYFNLVQPYQHHTRIPVGTGINVYSFGLTPEEHQPSGTVNMSRIDNATLNLSLSSSDASNLKVFAVNYNVLRIMSGMGGLAYSS